MNFDYLIVGAGFTGCVFAREIAVRLRKRVLIVDRRPYLGGVAYDYHNKDGILVHGHGMHVIHTNSKEVFEYLSQFTDWYFTRTKVCVFTRGKLVPFPININTVNLLNGTKLKTRAEALAYFARLGEPIPHPKNAEEMARKRVGKDLFEAVFRGYTKKWWGIEAAHFDVKLTSGIVLRPDTNDEYQNDTYQMVPKDGYCRMFAKMLDHPLITQELGKDYRDITKRVKFERMIYTGPIDEYFNHKHGVLPYRSMRFEHETLNKEFFQPCHQVNYPNDHDYMRTFEFKHVTGQKHSKTTIIKEYPQNAGVGMELDYPIPLSSNQKMFEKYKRDSRRVKNVMFVGRLADCKYYTMGQTVARALTLFKSKLW